MSDDYGLASAEGAARIEAPEVDYKPRKPKAYNPPIGLIGAGGITGSHLNAYQALGLNVVAIADINKANAEAKRDAHYPDATVYTDHKELLARDDLEVVDVATHVDVRPSLVRETLESGRHVLSQKPFVLDVAEGRALVELAEAKGLKLAVNHNGRWAPHFSYLRNAIADGHIGDVTSINVVCHWDHLWIKDTPFEKMRHMLLYDFAIHWFDICTCFMQGEKPKRVFATAQRFAGQSYEPPSIASVVMEYANAQACMQFNAHVTLGQEDTTTVNGTAGTLRSRGPGLNDQPRIDLFLEKGQATADLEGHWFEEGFQGTMSELLCAIEEDRTPYNSAASNLPALETAFAAIKSADTGQPVVPGEVQVLERY
ncbi:MAG: Gfo/Idh/MocA family protein [Puniceicoccaceae bacterium]